MDALEREERIPGFERSMRIDAHAHFYPERFLDLIEGQGDKHPIEVRREGAGGERKLFVAGREFFSFSPDFFDLDSRLEQMAVSDVDMQVISLGPPMVYWAESALGAELCRVFNDEMAQIVRRYPDRFVALAAVPLQDVGAAVSELERAARDLDVRGAMIPTAIGMKDLDSPEFIPFYEAAERMELPLFMHPMPRPGPEGLRLRDYRLDVTVGFVMDTTLAAARLVLSGIIPRLPGLNVMLSHLGGTVPFLWGRLSEGFRMFAGDWEWGEPRDYFGRYHIDAIAYRPEPLEYAVGLLGAEKILYGSDDPFFGAENMRQSADTILASQEFDEETKEQIFSKNAARLFRIDSE